MIWLGRFGIYIAGLMAGGMALAGYADFDAQTWVLDIAPFNLREFILTGVAMIGNGLAAIALARGWRAR